MRDERFGQKDKEFRVSIFYKALHRSSGKVIDQHRTFCVDFSSWTSLERDCKTLAAIYHDIYLNEGGFDKIDSEIFWRRINQFRHEANAKAKAHNVHTIRQP